ncbi:hypothetical protein BOSEA1005_20670 [Hyphomicrobiales bacterium]|nr:hypothetical protein BOSEA1005_20670 [Hyphomicrobiales bacterium]CAI0344849.1 hypothetical protein BO1005MUT1_350216 [Hyphomicrobiales bacterium]
MSAVPPVEEAELAVPARPQGAHDPEVELTTLPSGLRIVSQRMDHAATVSLGIWIGAGSRDELPHEHGLAHLLEHMAFKGTARRNAREIAEEIEGVGGDLNAATSVEYTCYTARVLGTDLELAVDILADIVTSPALTEEELKREKGVILQEISAVQDTPDDLVYDRFLQAAFPDQPIGRPILGTVKTVKNFTPAAIRAYLARNYHAGNMVLAPPAPSSIASWSRSPAPICPRFRRSRPRCRSGSPASIAAARLASAATRSRSISCSACPASPSPGARIIRCRSSPRSSAADCRRGSSRRCARSAASPMRSTPSTGPSRIAASSASAPGPLRRMSES